MSLFLFLTVVQAIVAFSLVAVVLMQRSEGGGLGIGGGGSPGGLMSARGAADFMTRMTTILAILFVVLSIALATVAVGTTSGRDIDDTLDRSIIPASESAPLDPLGTAAGSEAVASDAVPEGISQDSDPLAGAAQ